MRLLGSLQFEPLPQLSPFLSLPQTQSPPFFFSQDSFPERSRHQNGGRGIGPGGVRKGSQTGFAPAPPRTDLGLSLLSPAPPDSRHECAAATPSPADLQRAGVGAGRCCSRALGPFPAPRPRQPLPPRVLRPHPQPLPSPPPSRVHHCPAGTQE